MTLQRDEMMATNVQKQCPKCGTETDSKSEILCAVIIAEDGIKVSYNQYRCIKKHHSFLVKRKGDKKEQELTEKYIKSSHINLEKDTKDSP